MSAVSSRLGHRHIVSGAHADGSLAGLPVGAGGVVTGLRGLAPEVARRLHDLGFTAGSRVDVRRRAPFGGPVIVRVADYDVALRRREALAIRISTA
ncbi:MAG: FeoA family protein [Tetrasphaera sp.]